MNSNGLLSLKWNNHRSTFFHVLETLRNKELYSDVTIACDGKYFSVHKLVLSTCSEYFKEILEQTQCKHPVIVLKDIDHKEFEALLNYMYLGEVNVIQTDLSTLIKAAECLKVKGLAVPDEPPDLTSQKRNSLDREERIHSKRRKRGLVGGDSESSSRDKNLSKRTPSPNESQHMERLTNDSTKSHREIEATIKKELNTTDENSSSILQTGCDTANIKKEICNNPIDISGDDESPYQNFSDAHDSTYDPEASIPSFQSVLPDWSSADNSIVGKSGASDSSSSHIVDGNSYDNSAYYSWGEFATTADIEMAKSLMFKEGDLWKCKYENCIYTSINKRNLQTHTRTHSGQTPFCCTLCDYRSKQSSNLYTHMKKRHGLRLFVSGEDQIQCHECPALLSASALPDHLRMHSSCQYTCKICGYRTIRKDVLDNHTKSHQNPESSFPCPHCPFSSMHKNSLLRHLNSHQDELLFSCQFCTYGTSDKSNFRRHVRRRHPNEHWEEESQPFLP